MSLKHIPVAQSHIVCLCGSIAVSGSLLDYHSFPLTDAFCHCNPCRRTSGALAISYPNLQSSPPSSALEKCTAYQSSSKATRYFCSTCGSKTFVCLHQSTKGLGDRWFVASGIIESIDTARKIPDTTKILSHDYVSDTIDGGLAPRLLTLGTSNEDPRPIPCWDQSPGPPEALEGDISFQRVLQMQSDTIDLANAEPIDPDSDEVLPARCHCGGVDLLIHPVDYTNPKDAKSIPKKFIPPSSDDKTKFEAYPCACRSCRLATGSSIVNWAYIPVSKTTAAKTGEDVLFGLMAEFTSDANKGLPTLKQFWSTPMAEGVEGVCRYFCATCGATVFLWSEELAGIVAVAAGILRAGEGVMARRWLRWDFGGCSRREDAVDEEILEGLLERKDE
ncbi:MAG: hypothetical protein Q9160_003399 [Pyrenula sp. 1 TL-2023]